jgi:hypothetical protein
VLVVNFGIWFNVKQRRLLNIHMRGMASRLAAIKEKIPGFKIVWVDSVAQHFCAPGGVFQSTVDKKAVNKGCCMPKNNVFNTFRQDSAKTWLLQPHPGIVSTQIDLFSFTSPLAREHPGGGDCTHYCSNVNGPVQYLAIKFIEALRDSRHAPI